MVKLCTGRNKKQQWSVEKSKQSLRVRNKKQPMYGMKEKIAIVWAELKNRHYLEMSEKTAFVRREVINSCCLESNRKTVLSGLKNNYCLERTLRYLFWWYRNSSINLIWTMWWAKYDSLLRQSERAKFFVVKWVRPFFIVIHWFCNKINQWSRK